MCTSVEGMETCEINLESDAFPFQVYDGLLFRSKLKRIDEELVKKDVERLKFLCRDLIPASSLEEIQRGIDLFDHLETKQKLGSNNLKYLAECLLAIERADLLWQFEIDINDLRSALRHHEEVSKYRKLLLQIADDLTKKEVSTLVYLAKPHLAQRGVTISKMNANKIISPLQLFLTLEQSQCLRSSDLTLLAELLGQIKRPDLCQKVYLYQECVGEIPSLNENHTASAEFSGFTDMTDLPGGSEPVRQTCQSATAEAALPELTNYFEKIYDEEQGNIAISIKESQANNPFQTDPVAGFYPTSGNITEGVKKMKIDTDLSPELPRLPEYNMSANPRGYCLIINNLKFYHIKDDDRSHELKHRDGSDVDAKNLAGVFEVLDFLVDIKENLTDTEMVKVCTQFSMSDHTNFDCFVCCILTHGEQGSLFGCNGYKCPINEVTSCFKAQRCPSLVGKPKLFFLQACQGKQKQNGYSDDIEMDAPNPQDPPRVTIPDEADFLLGYATVPGFVSYRSKTQGSWFITKLCEKLHTFGKEYDLLSVLTLVNEEVSMGNASQKDGTFKQVPAPMHTLRKKVQFC